MRPILKLFISRADFFSVPLIAFIFLFKELIVLLFNIVIVYSLRIKLIGLHFGNKLNVLLVKISILFFFCESIWLQLWFIICKSMESLKVTFLPKWTIFYLIGTFYYHSNFFNIFKFRSLCIHYLFNLNYLFKQFNRMC